MPDDTGKSLELETRDAVPAIAQHRANGPGQEADPDNREEQRDERRAIPLPHRSAHGQECAREADQVPESRESPCEPHRLTRGILDATGGPIGSPEPGLMGLR